LKRASIKRGIDLPKKTTVKMMSTPTKAKNEKLVNNAIP
jgi:hypothetical protein